MLNKLKPQSEFSRNVLTLMTGTTIAQAIPVAISPILTRIYTPEDFGVFALFIAISTIFGSIANGRYELAIMLPKKDEDAINIFALGFIITSAISILLLVFVLMFNKHFTTLLNNNEIGIWLYFIPIAVFFIGLFNILNYFNNRRKNYKDLRNATVIKSIVLAIVQLSIGLLKQGASGLISGQIVSQFFANTRLLKNIISDKLLISKISKVKMIALAKRYKNFPKFSMWAGLANTLSTQLINILITLFYSISTLGFYSLVQRVLILPSSLIGGSIGQVFFQEATKEKQQTGTVTHSFNATLKKLIIIGIIPFGILYFTVEELFAFIFGEEWRIAGVYAGIMMPLFYIRFFVSPLTIMNIIFPKNHIGLYWQIGLLILHTIILVISSILSFSFEIYLYIMTGIISLYYLFILYIVSTYNNLENSNV